MKTEILNVNGMSCAHCEKAVNDAVGALSGVTEVKADAKNKTVTVVYNETKTTVAEIGAAIEEEGFELA